MNGQLNRFRSKKEEYLGILTVILSVFVCYCVIWAFTDQSIFGSSPYCSYVLQARRWLQGHLDLGQDYQYLELAIYDGKYFVSFPPVPSMILLPFCRMKNVPDNLITTIIGIIGAVFAYKMVYNINKNSFAAVFFALLATIGGNFLHIGFNGGVWYIAQVCAFTFTILAFYFALNMSKKRGWLPLFFLAIAFGSRPLQIVYTPLIIWLMYDYIHKNDISIAEGIKKFWWWFAPALAFGIVLMILNAARFGNPFEFGHNYLPEFSTQNETGQFNAVYFADNIKRMFELPKWNENGILEFPEFNGCAFWLISPIYLALVIYFVRDIKRNVKSPVIWAVIVLIAVHIALTCFHRTLGGSQFGNRYTVDMIPAVLLGIVLMMKNERYDISRYLSPLLLWGLGINLVGTVLYFLD